MARRDRDPRPPVEVLGAEEPDAHLQRVEVGSQRNRPGLGLLAIGGVALLLVGGIVLGGSDDASDRAAGNGEEERDNAERIGLKEERTTTTTRRPRPTTTTVQPRPLLPGSGVRLLVIANGREAELVDLSTGETLEVGVFRDAYSAVAVRGGAVLSESRTARFRPLPSGEPVDLGDADQVFPHHDPDAVWLLTDPGGKPSVTLVGLDGHVRAGPITLRDGWVIGSSLRGMIIQAGGRIYELDDSGEVRPIASGEAIGVSEGRLVARTCDDQARCRFEVWDRELRTSRPLDAPSTETSYYGATIAVQPGGALATMQLYGQNGTDLALVDLDGGPYRLVEGVGSVSAVAWLPGDLGFVVVKQSELLRVQLRGGEILVEELRGRGGDQVLVIS